MKDDDYVVRVKLRIKRQQPDHGARHRRERSGQTFQSRDAPDHTIRCHAERQPRGKNRPVRPRADAN